jgi:hypothetical protein
VSIAEGVGAEQAAFDAKTFWSIIFADTRNTLVRMFLAGEELVLTALVNHLTAKLGLLTTPVRPALASHCGAILTTPFRSIHALTVFLHAPSACIERHSNNFVA